MLTLAPPFGARLVPEEERSETVVVDASYLDRMMAPDPPSTSLVMASGERVIVGCMFDEDLEDALAEAPLPEPQEIGGYEVGGDYLRRIAAYAQRERQRRLGARHP